MSKYQWYFGDGTFLEGEEAYEHVRKLNQNVIETKKLINQQLNHFMDYLNEYDENDSDDFEALFDNVMEIEKKGLVR